MSATSRESVVSRASSGVAPDVTGEKGESTFGDMQVSIDKVFFKKCISYLFFLFTQTALMRTQFDLVFANISLCFKKYVTLLKAFAFT
mgnify:CR=1 FL=1